MDPDKKKNFIFPTKYVIPKSLKFSHWLSELHFFRFKRVIPQLLFSTQAAGCYEAVASLGWFFSYPDDLEDFPGPQKQWSRRPFSSQIYSP